MRRWRQFEERLVEGVAVTMYGPSAHARAGMLVFCEQERHLPPPGEGAAVLCPLRLAGEVERLGHVPIVAEQPRARFWEMFRMLPFHDVALEVHGDLAPTTVVGSTAFKKWQGRLVANHGGVYIGEGASLGEFTAVDAGIYGEFTEIHEGTHIDNLVHIGHSAIIGHNCTIVAHAGIGGWAELGSDVWIGLGAQVRDNVRVGAGAVVGMGAVVVGDVPPGVTVVGNPARELKR